MPRLTRISAVVDRLVTLCGEATGLQVVDGPFVGELADDTLLLGIPDGNTPGYRTTVTRQEGLGRPRLVEAWEVHCLLSLASAAETIPQLRARASSLLGSLDDTLRADVRSDGVWDRAGFGNSDMSWIPLQGPTGATLAVLFSLEGESLL
jgi:hypothetical protein